MICLENTSCRVGAFLSGDMVYIIIFDHRDIVYKARLNYTQCYAAQKRRLKITICAEKCFLVVGDRWKIPLKKILNSEKYLELARERCRIGAEKYEKRIKRSLAYRLARISPRLFPYRDKLFIVPEISTRWYRRLDGDGVVMTVLGNNSVDEQFWMSLDLSETHQIFMTKNECEWYQLMLDSGREIHAAHTIYFATTTNMFGEKHMEYQGSGFNINVAPRIKDLPGGLNVNSRRVHGVKRYQLRYWFYCRKYAEHGGRDFDIRFAEKLI